MAKIRAGQLPGPEMSIGKLALTQNMTRLGEVLAEMLGPRLAADSGEWGTYAWHEFVLGIPGMRVAGGTDEIMRNIVGERVLGLPKERPNAHGDVRDPAAPRSPRLMTLSSRRADDRYRRIVPCLAPQALQGRRDRPGLRPRRGSGSRRVAALRRSANGRTGTRNTRATGVVAEFRSRLPRYG
jgi:hypothetical protein